MRTTRLFLITLLSLLSTAIAVAQEVIVNVTPVQSVLPPQALLYVSDPGKYFNITLTNTSSQAQNVYLALSVHQVTPSNTVNVITPSNYPPKTPFTVPANGTKTLTTLEMKTMFNHIPASQIKTSAGLFDNYQNGSFGLLPEGDYEAQITAYRWSNPKLETPVVVSNPTGGKGYFTVCYKAQAPQFLLPVYPGALASSNDVAEVDVLNPMFTWTAPIVTCSPSVNQYRYSFKVVEVLKNQSPTEAIEKNPVVYKADNLTVAQCIIPQHIITSQFYVDRTYACQVTASSASGNALNYVMVENDGKSDFRLFKLKTSDMQDEKKEEKKDDVTKTDKKEEEKKGEGDKKEEEKKEEDKKGNEETDGENTGGRFIDDDFELFGDIDPTKPYTFKYPDIQTPVFARGEEARKMIEGQDLRVSWVRSSYIGGEGDRPDTVKVSYDVQIFNGPKPGDIEAALATEPIFSERTTKDSLNVPWEKIEELVTTGSYMVLRVNPVADTTTVAFRGEETHIRDFALVESLVKKYFQCSNMLDITNFSPTEKKAEYYRGKTISIGQYKLTIDEIKDGQEAGTFQGKGHVAWAPFGFEIGVCVKFSKLKINTDDMVIDGTAESYSQDEVGSDIQVVDKLFSDWGIDNLISDTSIPYAKEISGSVKGEIKDIAKQIDLQKYYGYVKKGSAIVNALTTGKVADLYMPLSIPKSINKSPVDIQIVGMKFAATYATMDILGEFTLPNSNYIKNDILVLGAPRICISPDRLLPESGTIALLSDFTINDPKSTYELTFKAPTDVTEPSNGCFVSWHADKFEMLGLDLDMKIPGLLKDKNGVATKEQPVFNAQTTISDWDDWMAEVTVDPFQVSALPGWTFTASNIIYDHSFYRNSSNMGSFPTGYDKKKAGITSIVTNAEGQNYSVSGDDSWQGLYIKEIALKFPKALEFGTSGDKRLEISAKKMFFDKSGATLNITAGNILSAKTGKAGGWAFSLDKVYASFIQSNFSKCGFSGKFEVPLLSGEIGYECKIQRLTSNTGNAGQYAYIFKTQQVKGLSLDFFLAKAEFNKDQTYFLLESVPTSTGTQETTCELLMGGDVTIGGESYIKNVLKKKLKMNIEIPGAHFCGMRISNKPSTWTSKYEADMQKKAKNVKLKGLTLYTGKDMQFGSSCYFNPGNWSLASDQKKVGGFDLSLSQWKFDKTGNDLKLYLQGKISLVSGIDFSAQCGIEIYATANMPKSFSDLKNISIKYKETKFKDLTIDATFSGMGLKGTLKCGDDSNKEGYEGSLSFTMPGDLFKVDANGGYFKYGSGSSKYTYGWFYIKAGSKSGIQAPPIAINSLSGGFYYNCRRNGTSATPEKGLIGVVAGMKISTTAGEDALNADMEMTVVYDSKYKRLSTFLFNGKVSAVSGLVSADANLVYENNNSTKYLQLDITVDAKADTEKIVNALTSANSSLGDLKKKLNSAYKSVQKLAPKGSLKDVDDKQGTPDKSKAPSKGESLSVGAGATINLQFKMTWKESGKTHAKPKWHLYLGEPDLNKRCTFTYLKFKSSILSVDIGANGYVCLGNELPNNGKLPPIPSKVANFLNGSSSGKGIESASLSEANKAREGSMSDFNSQIEKIGGGVMFGAQVYGYLDVNLGIFYLDAGATAGFDISIIKLPSNAYCTNFSGSPGYKGWYGYGQLYAYLYAKFGIRINLGFWKKDFDVADAGIGGLFQMQGPKPSHFEGKARVKLKLMGGLVNVDRKFAFEAGQSCDLFVGNALDNFKLFGDLSCGYDNKDQGWNKNNAISPKFLQRPYFTTEAPLNEPFRVLDETEKARLAKNYSGNKDDLDMEASRTFIFRSTVGTYVTLYEYASKTARTYTTRTFYIKGQNRYANYLDIKELNPNRYYKMEVTGYAKEIQKGKEVDPLKYNESAKKYYNEAWRQTKTYYFCTGDMQTLEDCPSNFEELIAIAYPSDLNKLKSNRYITSHIYDVQHPNLAFYSDVSKSILKKGTLKWRLYESSGKLASERNAKWCTVGGYSCNLIANGQLSASTGKYYRLTLEYEVSGRDRNGKVTTTKTNLVDLPVYAANSDWKNGYNGRTLEYERPFIGSRINRVNYKYEPSYSVSDYDISVKGMYNGKYLMVADPYWYISYLSNYAFFGGWEFDADRLDMNITTSQSLIYTDKGGVYEGRLGTGKDTWNTHNGIYDVRNLSVYTSYRSISGYPLPEIEDSKYNYTLSGISRIPEYTPGQGYPRRISSYIADFYSPAKAAEQMCSSIWNIFDWMDLNINKKNKGKSWTNDLNDLEDWYQARRGQYTTTKSGSATLQIPCYQFPIVYGSCFDNSGAKGKVTCWQTLKGYKSADQKNNHSRGHAKRSQFIHSTLYGKDNYRRTDGYFNANNKDISNRVKFTASDDYITSAEFSIYRCNTYNYEKCAYWTEYIYLYEPCFETFTISQPLKYYNNYGK